MCRHPLLAVLGLGLALIASPLRAQRRPDADPRATELLARADSLTAILDAEAKARRSATAASRAGHIVRAGRLVMVFWESVTPEAAQGIATRIDSAVEAFGGGATEWLDRIVAVQVNSGDTARLFRVPAFRHRTPIEVDWRNSSDSISGALTMADQIGRSYRASLDPSWREWLPLDFGLVWDRSSSAHGFGILTNPVWSSGTLCLAGRISECRSWLALDPAARPMATRFRAADLRGFLERTPVMRTFNPDRDRCVQGDDAACVRFFESRPVISPIPAPDPARASLVRALLALHGPAAVTRALGDATGSIGERFARAAGVSEDSLVSEWRSWTLARGRRDTLTATLPQSLLVIFASLLVVFLAARSGRWR
jgi:hypothetical protein